ncbi:helix-turn-helix domain-containing protein [Candidatus Sumerlaeota bacterium]|nr:helix-turn-helix domain-containing protein [Candidatus Sumerlaeota bacterium]
MSRKHYTTFDIAKICDVQPATVAYWIEHGQIPAHRTPGGHRRVAPEDLLEFLVAHSMPLPEDLYRQFRTRVLIIGIPFKSLLDARSLNAQSTNGLVLDHADNMLEVGLRLGRHQYQCIVLELSNNAVLAEAVELIRLIRENLASKKLRLIAFAPFGGERQVSRLRLAGCDEIYATAIDLDVVRHAMAQAQN